MLVQSCVYHLPLSVPPPSVPPPPNHPKHMDKVKRVITEDNFNDPPSTSSGVMFTKEDIEKLIGFEIVNFELYKTAFSYNDLDGDEETSASRYERMEFIGDSVLQFVVTKFLYDSFPGKNEGFLSKLRTKFVSGKFLSVIAWRLRLHEFIIMNQKGLMRGWNTTKRILEDTFEALMGAIYLDLGITAARQFFLNIIMIHADISELLIDSNYKYRLLKHARKANISKPNFVTVFERGGLHSLFIVEIHIDDKVIASGQASSRKDAEQISAKKALESFGVFDEIIT
jgi:ribonuclease-3